MAEGYAVKRGGLILVDTIQKTQRGAMVNGLVVLFGITPMSDWSDEYIATSWVNARALTGTSADYLIVPVKIEEAR